MTHTILSDRQVRYMSLSIMDAYIGYCHSKGINAYSQKAYLDILPKCSQFLVQLIKYEPNFSVLKYYGIKKS